MYPSFCGHIRVHGTLPVCVVVEPPVSTIVAGEAGKRYLT